MRLRCRKQRLCRRPLAQIAHHFKLGPVEDGQRIIHHLGRNGAVLRLQCLPPIGPFVGGMYACTTTSAALSTRARCSAKSKIRLLPVEPSTATMMRLNIKAPLCVRPQAIAINKSTNILLITVGEAGNETGVICKVACRCTGCTPAR